uniref:Uncharacterized protein n=1 Tax=Anguilla anguilla TaxID=7936 RepID=A0A0E9UAE2_ANGAN
MPVNISFCFFFSSFKVLQ